MTRQEVQDVVVVGAGLAGLVCAQRLRMAGYRVRVLEKSRGLGGRMATRRLEGVPVDHGARFVCPQGEKLTALTTYLTQQGVLTRWHPHEFDLDSTGQLNPVGPALEAMAGYSVAPAGMSAIAKAIAPGVDIQRQHRVTAFAPTPDQHWQITTERADDGTTATTFAVALVLAFPAPQIVPLLAPLAEQLDMAGMLEAIAAVRYAPCITLMAQYTPPLSQAHAPLPCEPTAPWMVQGHADTPFFWIGLDSSKRQAPGLTVVLQSSAAFAEHWLDTPTLQAAGEALLTQGSRLIAPWLAHPVRWQVHRWRYALVERPCPQGILTLPAPLPLVACGDWCGDRQLETALEAGWAAADQVNTQLQGPPLPPFPVGLIPGS